MLDKIFDESIEQINIPVNIGVYQKDDNYVETSALWDTGATISSVSEEIATQLGLKSIRQVSIGSATGSDKADVCMCRFKMEDGVTFDKVALILPIQNPGVIIGLDIIKHGDFCLTNESDAQGEYIHFVFKGL